MNANPEDPYDTGSGKGALGDFFNEFGLLSIDMREHHWTDEIFVQKLRERPIRTISVFYANDGPMMEILSRCPAKVRHIDRIVSLANSCISITSFKPMFNELMRLIYGKSVELHFPGPEFNPDHVSLKE